MAAEAKDLRANIDELLAQEVARKSLTKAELVEHATKVIQRAQRQTKVLMKEGIIAPLEQL